MRHQLHGYLAGLSILPGAADYLHHNYNYNGEDGYSNNDDEDDVDKGC